MRMQPEKTPLHHMDEQAWQAHLASRGSAHTDTLSHGSESAAAGQALVGPERDALQEAGTQEILNVRRELLAEICEFAQPGGPGAALFEMLDPGLATETDPLRRLLRYEQVCVDYFDFRIGPDGRPRERQDVDATLKLPKEVVGAQLWDTIFTAADELGMVNDTELLDGEAIDHVAIFGGTAGAIKNRTKYAVEQITAHDAIVGTIDFIASEGKPDSEGELDYALKEAAGLGATTEVSREAYADGVVITFAPVEINGRMVPVRVLVANRILVWNEAKQEHEYARARTLETLRLWGQASNIQPGDNVVGVTTELYTGFQNANGREVLTYDTGARVRVIGHSAAWAGTERYANQLAQEIKAKVDSECRLYRKLVETGIAPSNPEHYDVRIEALYEPVPDMQALREGKEGYTTEPIDTEHPLHREPLVRIRDYGIAGQSYYSRPNAATGEAVPGVPSAIELRRSIVEELQRINNSLRDPAITAFFGGEVELYVEEGLRKIEVQQRLHDELVPALIRQRYPGMSDAEVARRVKDIIAVPANNPSGPSPHLTGGAFDVILRYKQDTLDYVPNVQVPMGHFDGEVSERLYPDHFEHLESLSPDDLVARRNRRAFNAIMTGRAFGIRTEFVANPTEWFHYSARDQLWARVRRLAGGVVSAIYSIAPSVNE